jgi:hypothetical protein
MKYNNFNFRNEWVELNYKELKLYEKKVYKIQMSQKENDIIQ